MLGCTSGGYVVCQGDFFSKSIITENPCICIPQLPRWATSSNSLCRGSDGCSFLTYVFAVVPMYRSVFAEWFLSRLALRCKIMLSCEEAYKFQYSCSLFYNSLIGKFVPIVLFLRSRLYFSCYLFSVLWEIIVTILKEREMHLNLSFHYH